MKGVYEITIQTHECDYRLAVSVEYEWQSAMGVARWQVEQVDLVEVIDPPEDNTVPRRVAIENVYAAEIFDAALDAITDP